MENYSRKEEEDVFKVPKGKKRVRKGSVDCLTVMKSLLSSGEGNNDGSFQPSPAVEIEQSSGASQGEESNLASGREFDGGG